MLAGDDDFAVRLMLCERQDDVPPDLVVRTYLEARVITRSDLLRHPRFPRTDLVRYADSPHWGARALVTLDPGASPEQIDRLSRDDHPGVRCWMADDDRLSPDRVVELLAAEETAEPAARNPNLPRAVMDRILAEATELSEPPVDAAVMFGHTFPPYQAAGGI